MLSPSILMSTAKRSSDVALEVADIVFAHRMSRVERVGDVTFRPCDNKQQGEEASLAFRVPPYYPRFALLHDLTKRGRVTGAARQLAAEHR